MHVTDAKILSFERSYNATFEDQALAARGEFLRTFPIGRLKNLTLEEYAIGGHRDSFCAFVEPKTKAWAVIQGATAFKFGIYYGRTKDDSKTRYRAIKKFGGDENPEAAFIAVRQALIQLVQDGEARRFKAVDENPLSQMFKAKVLSLYFPNLYLNVCSRDRLDDLSEALKLPDDLCLSEVQHLLLMEKLHDRRTKDWSNPKFMAFLFKTYLHYLDKEAALADTKKSVSRRRTFRPIDFDTVNEARKKRGKTSEKFAWDWEKDRLFASYPKLVDQIEDRREMPGYGYDFDSFSKPGVPRHIEVKSVSRLRGDDGFYLTFNERRVAESSQCRDNYYFYLVHYDRDGKPERVEVQLAKNFLRLCTLNPVSWTVTF